MKIVIQRVKYAKVEVENQTIGEIGPGLLVYLGVGKGDTTVQADFIAAKIAELRIFADENGKMNHSVQDISGSVLLVSQFTLYGDCRKGRRPGFEDAGDPDTANKLYQYVGEQLSARQIPVQYGRFAAHMQVTSCNDGPVTIQLTAP